MSPQPSRPLAVDMRGITKRFPGVVANDQVDFQLEAGEIHAILGENGAGKSTVMHILSGLYRPDAGEIRLHGATVDLRHPNDAIAHGIGMVHQHFMLVPVLTVTENILLGREETSWGPFVNLRRAAQRVQTLAARYHLEVDPHALVQDLPIGIRQRVEILKALYRQAEILILDEPTAVLTPAEATRVLHTLTHFAQQGKAVILITHKLRDVLHVAHRITVLRAGRVVGTLRPAETTETRLAAMMVGHHLPGSVLRALPRTAPDVALCVQHIQALDERGAVAVDSASLTMHSGEILGLAGVQGNGQTELIEVLTGLRQAIAGTVTLCGTDVTRATPRQLTAQGLAHIPEDRHTYGMVAGYPIADNLVLTAYDQPPFAQGILRRPAALLAHARRVMEAFDIRAPGPDTPAGHLSGGNQQKMVVARACSHPRRVLIAAYPTRGLDVGAIALVHHRLVQQRNQGCAVLLVSADLDEILALSDRVAVMYQGRIVATVSAADATRDTVGRLMGGLQISD